MDGEDKGQPREPDAHPSTPHVSHTDPKGERFTPADLLGTVIAIPLLEVINAERDGDREPGLHKIVIDLNLNYPGGRDLARERVWALVRRLVEASRSTNPKLGLNETKSRISQQYVFVTLDGESIRELVRLDRSARTRVPEGISTEPRAIFRIWPDFPIEPLTTKSISTIKADAARISFSALGDDIVWAVIDSGIDKTHRHFEEWGNLDLDEPLTHYDFTGEDDPHNDAFGHGTHVAGIIAGEVTAGARKRPKIKAVTRYRDEDDNITYREAEPRSMSGVAPRCKLVSMRVLDENGDGETSSLIAAIEEIQRLNGFGRRLLIHGVNLSVGYTFDPEWFACGQSPLCVEVNRLVRSGVVVVVAAGNTGYGWLKSAFRGTVPAGAALTINDPGNAELAITVGATHRESPHTYGVSYFSSKGPTGDGRMKPDLIAPGEKIISCAAGSKRQEIIDELGATTRGSALYIEDSGTSMAAPHVSGAIAAFLSVRREFIGKPEQVKEIFLSSATDLKRDRTFQGHGLVDLMRAIQSV